jgi:cytochrome c biogenesis protein CcmG, thiol:disulfide interchange protein DsbE
MRISFRHWVPLGLFAVVAVVLWQGLKQDPHRLPSVMVHKAFPHFKAQDLQAHNAWVTEASWKGEVVVLNVFASWCLSCQIEHPQLMDMSQQSKATWVGLDYMDRPDSVKKFLLDNGSPYQVVLNDPDGHLAINLGVYGVPETFVIDRDGTICYRHAGPLTQSVWEKELRPLLIKLRTA